MTLKRLVAVRLAFFLVALAVLAGIVVGWIGGERVFLLKPGNLLASFLGGVIVHTILWVRKEGSLFYVLPRVMIIYGVALLFTRLAAVYGIYFGVLAGILVGLFYFGLIRWLIRTSSDDQGSLAG